jgi:hypothetical protein
MKAHSHLLAATLIGLLPTTASAAGPSSPDTINVLVAKSDGEGLGPGEAYVYAASGSWSIGNPDGCTTAYPYTYSMTTVAGKALHATLLAAHLAGKTITLYINGCLSGKPRITRVDLR